MSVSHDNSLLLMPLTACSSVNLNSVPKTHPKPDPHTSILKSENLPKNQDEKEKYINIVLVEKSVNDTKEYEDNSETLNRADIRMVLSGNAQQEGQGDEIHPTQMLESLQIDFSLQSNTGDTTESLKEQTKIVITAFTEASNNGLSNLQDDSSSYVKQIIRYSRRQLGNCKPHD